MTNLLDRILSAPAWVVYATVAALVFVEDALFVGFVLPGKTAAVLGGVAASRGHVDLVAMCAIVVAAAIIGDSVGYEIGRHYGTRLLAVRPLARHHARVSDAQQFLAVRGGAAVFLARFVAFFRAVMPALAGSAHMRYRTFLAYNAAGGLCWGIAFVLLGYFAGNSYARIEQAVGRDLALVVLAVAVAALLVWRVRRHRAATSPPPSADNSRRSDPPR